MAEGAAAPDAASAGRSRSIYAGPWRIDLTIRRDVPRLVPAAELAGAIARALAAAGAPKPGSVGLILTNDADLASLNLEHMGEHGPTDVLSFPMLSADAFRGAQRGGAQRGGVQRGGPQRGGAQRGGAPDFPLPPAARQPLGDIVVSVERAVAQAEQGRGGQTGDVRWSPADELRLLVTHGALHLCGWDHAEPAEEAAMRALEQKLLVER